jgi:hypothetical protein
MTNNPYAAGCWQRLITKMNIAAGQFDPVGRTDSGGNFDGCLQAQHRDWMSAREEAGFIFALNDLLERCFKWLQPSSLLPL